jgi:hydrogenase-4 component B
LTQGALIAGIALLLAGSGLAMLSRTFVLGLSVQAAGAAAVAGSGLAILLEGQPVGAGFSSDIGLQFGADPLSAVFLLALGLVAAPSALYASEYLHRDRRGCAIAGLSGLFVAFLVLVLCARDVISFLAGWELMTLVPATIILIARSDETARQAVFQYVGITHVGGVGVWVALITLAHIGAFGNPQLLAAQPTPLLVVIWIAALIGFCSKAGVMPVHVWLPRTHPIAPAPISALMSGVMIKVAIYGLIRVLVDWTVSPPVWLGIIVIALGALSALGGVTYALFAHDLKRLLALHSIENIGIILLGVGAALILRSAHQPTWAAIALAAALLHTINHAVFKGLLFLGAGAFDRAVGSLEIDRLGGLLRRMPLTSGAFLIGAASIAGLPPLNGFASEWLTSQALLALPLTKSLGPGVVGAISLVALAMTAALAVFCFAKVVGLVLLGSPRRRRAAAAREVRWPMWGATGFLAACCVVLGAVPGLILPALIHVWPGASRTSYPITPGLSLPGSRVLPTLTIVAIVGIFTVVLTVLRSRSSSAQTAPTWVGGQPVDRGLAWTSAGFTKPLRLILEGVLRPQREIRIEESAGVTQRVSYQGDVPHHFDAAYQAVSSRALSISARARRLQSGDLGLYVAHLIALIIFLFIVLRLGLMG